MIYREFGKTNKKVSVISLGGMRFGEDEDEAVEVIQKAYSLGINYFDTAHLYCNSRSEHIFGKAFKNMKGEYYVSTKSMVSKDPTGQDVRNRIEASLKIMGIEKIHFFYMWCIMDLEEYHRIMVPGGPYEGALQAKKEGLIDHILFSTHCKGEDIVKIIEDQVFEGVLLGYNVINHPFRQLAVDSALKHNIGVVTMNPLGGGLIPQHKEYFNFLRERENETVSQAALRFNAAQKGITTVLSGMGTIKEVEENVDTINYPLTISQQKIIEIREKITDTMNVLCTNCGYCDKCPEKIKIPKYLEAYNLLLLKDPEEMKKRIYWLKENKSLKDKDASPLDCTACGKCEKLCTQKLPIIERLKEIGYILK
jgi:uncharacterized protein